MTNAQADWLSGDPTLPGHPDPYPYYHRLRAEDPVHWSALTGTWALARYRDAAALLRDRRFGRAAYLDAIAARFGGGPIFDLQRRELSFMDPPHHTRVKSLIAKAFTPSVVDGTRPHIQRIVDGFLDRATRHGAMDVIADLAYPLPATVVSEMLGVPEEDRPQMQKWVDDFAAARGVARSRGTMAAGYRAAVEFGRYFERLAAERAGNPATDLLSALILAEEDGHRLDHGEVLAIVTTLFTAGHATMRGLIGNGTPALLRNPEEAARLRANSKLIESAVEEMARYDSPTQAPSPLVAQVDVEIGGKTTKAGEPVTVLIGAADRDPARFSEPDRLDITRADNEPLAFSFGIHYCLGASLVHAQTQIAIGSLFARFARITLAAEQLQWQRMGRFRCLLALSVIVSPT